MEIYFWMYSFVGIFNIFYQLYVYIPIMNGKIIPDLL
jgi:hypothetical protein